MVPLKVADIFASTPALAFINPAPKCLKECTTCLDVPEKKLREAVAIADTNPLFVRRALERGAVQGGLVFRLAERHFVQAVFALPVFPFEA
jgi:hypothetical protein